MILFRKGIVAAGKTPVANLLVRGGAGFVGGKFVHHWSAAQPDYTIIVLDCLTYAGMSPGRILRAACAKRCAGILIARRGGDR